MIKKYLLSLVFLFCAALPQTPSAQAGVSHYYNTEPYGICQENPYPYGYPYTYYAPYYGGYYSGGYPYYSMHGHNH